MCVCVCVSIGEVVFDRTHPGFPPDIIFSSEDELMEFDPNIDQLEVAIHYNIIYTVTVYYMYIVLHIG